MKTSLFYSFFLTILSSLYLASIANAAFSDRIEDALVLQYLFTIKECQSGVVNEVALDTTMGPLNLGAGSSCPVVSGFENAKNGVKVAQGAFGQYPSAIISAGNVASLKANLNTASNPLQYLTFEVWFELDSTPPDDDSYTILEIGSVTPRTAFLGGATTDYGLKLTYNPKSAANNQLSFEVFAKLYSSDAFLTFQEENGSPFSAASSRLELTIGKIYHLVGVLAPNVTEGLNDDLNLYLNEKGQTPNLNPITTSGQNGNWPIGDFAFPDTHLLRIGTSFGTDKKGIPATFYMFALHTRALTTTEIRTNFLAGLPNSIPAAKNSTNRVYEDSSSLLSVNTGSFYYDNDGDNVKAVLTSLPNSAYADLIYDGVTLNSTHLNSLVITDFTKLFFQTKRTDEYDITASGTCSSATSKSQNQFTYKLTDTQCTAPTSATCLSNEVTAFVCVQEVNDAPVANNQTSVDINNVATLKAKVGGTLLIDLDGSDPDATSSPPGTNTLTSPTLGSIIIASYDGLYGDLYYENCSTPLTPNSPLTLSASGKFKVCYKADTVNATTDIVGYDTFSFKLRDSAGLESVQSGYFTITILNPLTACDPAFVADTTVRAVCANVGKEEKLIPVYLNAKDELSRTLEYEIASLPTFGTLCFVNDNNNPTRCSTSKGTVTVGSKVSRVGNKPNLFYQGSLNYYNERLFKEDNTPTWKDAGDKVIGTCSTVFSFCQNGVCCPDKFAFRAVTTGGAKSPNGNYFLFVQNEADVGYNITGPTEISVSTKVFNFKTETNSSVIQIEDFDGDAEYIGISIIPSKGQVRLTPPLLNGALDSHFKIDTLDCQKKIETGCDAISVSSSLSMLNTALQTLEYVPPAAAVNGDADQITIKFFKAFDGSYTGAADLQKKIKLKPVSSAPSTNSGELSVAIIAGVSAVGFIVFVALLWSVIWFCKKTRKMGKDAARTVKSMKSSSKKGAASGTETGTVAIASGKGDALASKSANVTATSSAESQSSKKDVGTSKSKSGTDSSAKKEQPATASAPTGKKDDDNTTADGADMEVVDDSIFDWEKHIDKKTGDVYFFNPKTGVSQWDPPTVKARRAKK